MILNTNKMYTLKCLIKDIDNKIIDETEVYILYRNEFGEKAQITTNQEKVIKYLETSKSIIKYVLGYSKPITNGGIKNV